MHSQLAKKILDFCLGAGASFAEIYEEETRKSYLSLKDNDIEGASASIIYGIGIRMLYGTEVLYGFTSDPSEDVLMNIAKNLSSSHAAKTDNHSPILQQAAEALNYMSFSKNNFKDPRILGQSYKTDFLFAANTAGRINSKIVQLEASIADSVQNINIWNSEGLQASDNRARTRFSVNVTAADGSERTVAHEAPGALGGFEVIDNLPVKNLSAACSERALRMLSASYIKGGHIPVIMGNAFGGVIFH